MSSILSSIFVCRERVDNALKALGTDYIDVLTLRLGAGPDSKGTSLEETARGMKVASFVEQNICTCMSLDVHLKIIQITGPAKLDI